jgi:hypothetical protein
MHTIPLRIGNDLNGTAVAYDGARLSFVAPKAFPPGQPLQLSLTLDAGELALQARSLGSKRRDDQRFDVQARLVSVNRTTREALQRAFSAA